MNNTILNFTTLANEWIEGIPLGNSRAGVMVWGGPSEQTYSFNQETLWRKNRKKELKTSHIINEVRELVLAGKSKEAHQLFVKEIEDQTDDINAYQPFYDLMIKSNIKNFENYERNLDVANGVLEIKYGAEDNFISSNTFVTNQYDMVIINQNSTKAVDYEFDIIREFDSDCEYKFNFEGNTCIFEGEFAEGVTFSSVISIQNNDGEFICTGNKAVLKNTTGFTVKITMATSFQCENHKQKCIDLIEKSSKANYLDIFNNHKDCFHKKFATAEFCLFDQNDATTDQLYNNIFEKNEFANSFYEQFFNMARYFVISTSSEDSLPINLQGIWNKDTKPMWECGHTMDMNEQMDYWLSLPANLGYAQMALFNWVDSLIPTMRKNAKDIFGIDGVYIPQYSDVFMVPSKCEWAGSFQVLWSGAATWIASHYFEYYKYTNDKEFLLKRAYPFMKECATFYKQFVVKNNEGKYIICPSSSPENMTANGDWLVNSATMDITLIKELTQNLLFINEKFKLGDTDSVFWQDLNKNMVNYPIIKDEKSNILYLEEWIENIEQGDLGHRHISHIYGIFPGKSFFQKGNEELKDAAIKALYRRRQNGFGGCATWSHAWYACCFARIGKGDEALQSINDLMETGMINNFITTHNDWRDGGDKSNRMIEYRLFQIEAILGAAAAMCEMFIQSFDDYIEILPALPKKWSKKGYIKGLKAYNNLEFDIYWENGEPKKIVAYSKEKGKVNLKLNSSSKNIEINNQEIHMESHCISLEYNENSINNIDLN